MAERVAALESFEETFAHSGFDFGKAVPAELWSEYWSRLDDIQTRLKAAQRLAEKIKASYPVVGSESEP